MSRSVTHPVLMPQVLQRSLDNRLILYSDAKEQTNPVAQLAVLGLSSQPVDHEENGHRKQASSDVGQSCIFFFFLKKQKKES